MISLHPFNYPSLFKFGFIFALLLGSFVAFAPADAGLQPDLNDKFLHGFAFFMLGLSSQLAFPTKPTKRLIIILLSYGIWIEFVQAFLPYRSASIMDFAADALGLLLYFGLLSPYMMPRLHNQYLPN